VLEALKLVARRPCRAHQGADARIKADRVQLGIPRTLSAGHGKELPRLLVTREPNDANVLREVDRRIHGHADARLGVDADQLSLARRVVVVDGI
jgi:hypothetical protein